MRYEDAQTLEYLNKLQDANDNSLKNSLFYIESSNRYKNLKYSDYRIIRGHSIHEYFNKYVRKLRCGLVHAYKRSELWRMNYYTTYWEIPNESDYVYFEVKSRIPKIIAIISAFFAVGVAAGVACGYFLLNKTPVEEGGGTSIDGIVDFETAKQWISEHAIDTTETTGVDCSWSTESEGSFWSESGNYVVQGTTLPFGIPFALLSNPSLNGSHTFTVDDTGTRGLYTVDYFNEVYNDNGRDPSMFTFTLSNNAKLLNIKSDSSKNSDSRSIEENIDEKGRRVSSNFVIFSSIGSINTPDGSFTCTLNATFNY